MANETATLTASYALAPTTATPQARVLRAPRVMRGLALMVISGLLVGWRRAEHPYADGDMLWGARAGLDFLRTGTFAHSDPYSWTAHGATWVPNSWGWSVVLGVTYRLGGLAGFALLGIVMSGCLGLLAGIAATRAGASGAMSGLVFQAVGGVLALFLYARAHIVDYSAVLAIPLLMPRVFDSDRGRALRAVGAMLALQIVWMNLHSAALIGPVLVFAAGFGHVAMSRDGQAAAAGRVAVLTGLTAGCCLATPYGTAAITHAADVRAASVGLISEWLPVGFGTLEQWLAVIALALAAIAVWCAWRARRFDTVAVLLVLAVASAAAIRFAPMLAFTAVPTLACACQRLNARPAFIRRLWVLTSAIFTLMCLAGVASFAQPGTQYYSPGLVAQLPSHCRLLNDYDIGGAVILNRPDVPVAIDGRNDVYGRALELRSWQVLADPDTGLAYIGQKDVTCVLAPSTLPLVRQLSTARDWRVAGRDSVRTLLIRRNN